jgi:hypothetical protein
MTLSLMSTSTTAAGLQQPAERKSHLAQHLAGDFKHAGASWWADWKLPQASSTHGRWRSGPGLAGDEPAYLAV